MKFIADIYVLFFPGIECWNPAFDVTPADLITGGIVTEHGVYKPDDIKQIHSNVKT